MSWLRRLSKDRGGAKFDSDVQAPDFLANSNPSAAADSAQPPSQQLHQHQQSRRPPTAQADSGVASGTSNPFRRGALAKDAQFASAADMLRRPGHETRGGGATAVATPGAGSGSDDDVQTYGRHAIGPGSSGSGVAASGTGSGPVAGHASNIRGASGSTEPLPQAPDSLTRAFNDALKPFTERIALLQADLDAAHNQIQSLEADKAAVQNWIDRRGLRPDLPPQLAAALDAGASAGSPVAASTLATQLDRKMTMLNFSLHQLADALPSETQGLPIYTVSTTLLSVSRQIKYLNTLSGGGPSFAFEACVKLAGNFNSHTAGGGELDESRTTVDDFYGALDYLMTTVVKRRLATASNGVSAGTGLNNAAANGDGTAPEDWDVVRDVRRLEKTAAFLKKELGIQHYFSRSLDLMRREGSNGAALGAGISGGGGGGGNTAGAHNGAMAGAVGSGGPLRSNGVAGLADEGHRRYSEESR